MEKQKQEDEGEKTLMDEKLNKLAEIHNITKEENKKLKQGLAKLKPPSS